MESLILELVVAVILGALGISAPLNSRLKTLIGVSLLDLVKPSFKMPEEKPEYTPPTFGDFMAGLGEFVLVGEADFLKYIKVHTETVPKIELVQGKGKVAMAVIHTLGNGKLAISVRWPSGNYYYLADT